jgi:hypothetical protein
LCTGAEAGDFYVVFAKHNLFITKEYIFLCYCKSREEKAAFIKRGSKFLEVEPFLILMYIRIPTSQVGFSMNPNGIWVYAAKYNVSSWPGASFF